MPKRLNFTRFAASRQNSCRTWRPSRVPATIRCRVSLASAPKAWSRFPRIPLKDALDIDKFLEKPAWDISALLGPKHGSQTAQSVDVKEVRHLLRLSALRIDPDEIVTEKQRRTLEAQLSFVKAVQSVDTAGVEPLVAIRDETLEAQKEAEITLDNVQEVFDREEQVGRYKRIVTKEADKPETDSERDQTEHGWNPVSRAPSKAGRYIKVNTKKS